MKNGVYDGMNEGMCVWCIEMDPNESMMDELMSVWCVHVHVHVYELDGGWRMDGRMDELMGVWCVQTVNEHFI